MKPLSKATEAWLRWLKNEPHKAASKTGVCTLCKRRNSDRVIHPRVWRMRRAQRHWLAGEPPMWPFGTIEAPSPTEE